MSWPATFVVALITAIAGTFAAGFTANLAVSWYRISSFEGQSGYFVVFIGLAGGIAGFILGGIVARIVTAGFLPAAGTSLGVVAGLALLIGGTARLLADVPPKIGGDTLLLALEYRWPASQRDAPTAGDREPHVQLSSVVANTARASAMGAFWFDDSRREEGRWVTPAAVDVFTERGKRVVAFVVDDSVRSGVLVPLPRRPSRKYLEWSRWLTADLASNPEGASYRFRVHPASQPIRTERVGPFELALAARDFWMTQDNGGRSRIVATSRFEIRHDGEPVIIEHEGMYGSNGSNQLRHASAVVVVPGPHRALLACMTRYDRPCFLIVSEDGRLRTHSVGELPNGFAGHEITSDPARHEATRTRSWLTGRVDKDLFEQGRIYQLGTALLDTRDLRVHPVYENNAWSIARWDPPLGLAPDARSFVRIGSVDPYTDVPVLVVTDLDGTNVYTLPIDRSRMRYVSREDIGPAWVMHHFEWTRNGDGAIRLVERRSFVPLPHQGTLGEEIGGYRQYQIDLAKEEMLETLLEFLFAELSADRATERDPYLHEYVVRIDGLPIKVGYNELSRYVYVRTDPDAKHAHVIATIAERFDAALATGRYDDLFAY